MNKKRLFLMTAAPCLLAISAFAGYQALKKSEKVSPIQGTDYTLTLDSDDAPNTLTASYQVSAKGTVTNSSGYEIDLDFVNAKLADGKFVELAPRGMIYNFGADDEAVTAINGIKYTGSGTLYARTAKGGQAGGAVLNDFQLLTAGTKKSLPVSDYFQLMAGDGGAVIDTLEISYTCEPGAMDFKNLSGKFTGVGDDGSTYKLIVNEDGSVAIDSLDKAEENQIHLTGTGLMVNASKAKCTFVYKGATIEYTMGVTADKHSLTYDSISDNVGGVAAAQVAHINFDRVYNVEDFESYTATGDGFTSTRGANSIFSMSGLRAHYYADYYGSNTVASPVGGSGWSMMGSSDFQTYKATSGRNGSKTSFFKGNGNSLRYISMNSYPGVPAVIGKGSTMSFWAKGPTTSDFSTNASAAATIKLYAFYNTQVTSSNQGTRTEKEFTIPVGSGWTQYTMELNPSLYYFGFGFLCKQSATTYTAIDDIEIYTSSPYAEYVPANPVTGIALNKSSLELQGTRGEQLAVEFTPADATDKRLEWSSNDETVATVDDNGVVHAVAAGSATITATSKDGSFSDNCVVTVSDDFVIDGMFLGYSNFSNPLGDDFEAYILIAINSNGQVEAFVNGANAIVTDKSFNMLTGEFTLTCTGTLKVSGQTLNIGNIHGYYDPTNQKLVNVGLVGGNISGYVDDNNSIECSNANALMTNNCDADTTTLRATFARREGSTWSVNKNIVESTNMDYVGGGKSVLFPIDNASTGGRCAFTLASDISNATLRSSAKNVAFWVYNPTDTDITAKLFVYNTASYGSNVNPNSFTFKAGQWTLCASGLGGVAQVYNLQFFIGDTQNKLKTDIMFDNFMLFR